jgi:hypothetical protein
MIKYKALTNCITARKVGAKDVSKSLRNVGSCIQNNISPYKKENNNSEVKIKKKSVKI